LKENVNACESLNGFKKTQQISEWSRIYISSYELFSPVNYYTILYLIGARRVAEEASRARVRCAWGHITKLAPVLAPRGASLKVKGNVYYTGLASRLS